MSEKDVAFTLSKYIANFRYEDLSAEAVEVAKKDILDIVGLALGGSGTEKVSEMVELVRDLSGKPESTVEVFGGKMAAPDAAFLNAYMAHALDFDDNHDRAYLHIGAPAVPSAFAIAERLGGVSGKQLITAVAIGIDLASRMSLATKTPIWTSGWIFTSMYGYFGSMAAAGKLLGLNEDDLINAFGIAYCQMGGNLQVIADDEKAMSKRLQVGFASKDGIMAALLAKIGLTGVQRSLEGRFGLYNLYHKGEYDRDALTNGLGKEFAYIDLSFKPYPCARPLHFFIDAAIQLKRDYNILPDDIEEIIPVVNRIPYPFTHPLDVKRNPTDTVAAQFSLPYVIAVGLTRGKMVIHDISLEALKDKEVLALAQKVTPRLDSSLTVREMPPGKVELKLKDGRTISSKLVEFAKGHPKNPMSMDELSDKFRDCAAHAAVPLPKENIEKAIADLRNLENVSDVRQIMQLVSAVK